MNTFKKCWRKLGLLGVIVVLATGVVVGSGIGSPHLIVKKAEAAAVSWGTDSETNVSWSSAVTAFTPAIIFTGVATVNPNMKTLTITSSASGVVVFHNANANTGATQVFAVGLLANTPVQISEEQFRQGYKFGLGNPIYIDGPTATVTLDYSVRNDPK